jgi:hypothetical protein
VRLAVGVERGSAYFYDDAIFLQVGEFFSRFAVRSDLKGITPASAGRLSPANKWIEKK